jgi:hypothetical protein
MLSTIAAVVFAALSTSVGVFQLALVFGAPWGQVTLGGRYEGTLPRHVRAAPAVSAVLIFGLALIVLTRAGLVFFDLKFLSAKLIWGVVAYCLLGSLLNYITPSKRERALWFPVVAVMSMCSLIVALA